MFEHAPGHQPIRIFGVRHLRGRLIGQSENARLAVGKAIKLDLFARLYERIAPLAIPPLRLLAVDDWPAQSAGFVIGVERREIMTMTAAEAGIFLEQPFLQVEAESLRLLVLE